MVALLLAPAGLRAAATPAERALEPYRAPAVGSWSDAQLRSFMRELADYVYRHHVVVEPEAKTYGMTYEYYDPVKDQRIQGFGLDAMHDGAWFTAAMMTAERIDPEGPYLEQALKYQIPFYVYMINNADRLFPRQKGGQPDVAHDPPMKGWVPRGWDEGLGYDINRRQFKEGYFTPSNHLAQVLGDMLLNVWMTTHAPKVAEAAQNLHQERIKAFGRIQVCAYAADYAAGKSVDPESPQER